MNQDPNCIANGEVDKNESRLSDTSDSDLELDNSPTKKLNSVCDVRDDENPRVLASQSESYTKSGK